jgi:hypothetical protein
VAGDRRQRAYAWIGLRMILPMRERFSTSWWALAASSSGRIFSIHGFWDAHIIALLREARPDLDAEVVGTMLLGALGGALVPELARAGETERLLAAVRELVESVLRAP